MASDGKEAPAAAAAPEDAVIFQAFWVLHDGKAEELTRILQADVKPLMDADESCTSYQWYTKNANQFHLRAGFASHGGLRNYLATIGPHLPALMECGTQERCEMIGSAEAIEALADLVAQWNVQTYIRTHHVHNLDERDAPEDEFGATLLSIVHPGKEAEHRAWLDETVPIWAAQEGQRQIEWGFAGATPGEPGSNIHFFMSRVRNAEKSNATLAATAEQLMRFPEFVTVLRCEAFGSAAGIEESAEAIKQWKCNVFPFAGCATPGRA